MIGSVVVASTVTSGASASRALSKSWLLHASTWARATEMAGDSVLTGMRLRSFRSEFLVARTEEGLRGKLALLGSRPRVLHETSRYGLGHGSAGAGAGGGRPGVPGAGR